MLTLEITHNIPLFPPLSKKLKLVISRHKNVTSSPYKNIQNFAKKLEKNVQNYENKKKMKQNFVKVAEKKI